MMALYRIHCANQRLQYRLLLEILKRVPDLHWLVGLSARNTTVASDFRNYSNVDLMSNRILM